MTTLFAKRPLWLGAAAVVLIIGILCTSTGRSVAQKWLSSLRVQKAQAVNVDLSGFTDPHANPALHQMVTQMISDKVNTTLSESDRPASDAAEAARLAGFPVALLRSRKDPPKLVVGGRHFMNVAVDRARLQEIVKAAGHPEIALPASLDGATVSVQIPHTVHVQYGTCPGRTSATDAIANQVVTRPRSPNQYADCVRLTEGPSPTVDVPADLDVVKLAEIGLQVAGMTPGEADDFFRAVDWKQTLTLSVPRQLRSYEQVKVNGVGGTLLTLSSRRGPGYTLIWAKNGIVNSLTGYGDSSKAVALADSLR